MHILTGNGDVPHGERISSPGMYIVYTGSAVNKVQCMYSNKVACTFLSQNQSANFGQVKENNDTFRTWDGPPKFCIEIEADWLIFLDEVRRKSPAYELTSIHLIAK